MYTIVITMQCKYSTTNARGIVSYKVVGSLQENKKYIRDLLSFHKSSYRSTQVKTSGLLCKNNVSFTVLGRWWEKASTFDLRLTASTLPYQLAEQHKVTGTQSSSPLLYLISDQRIFIFRLCMCKVCQEVQVSSQMGDTAGEKYTKYQL